MNSYAYVIMHFGSNIKYLEYEIYLIIMLKSISNYDIIYMYSIIDTPDIFVKTIKKMGVKTLSYDDTVIYEKSIKFNSFYKHFNLLRISCFVYANLLVEYEKVCIVESDIILYEGFESVFDLKIPSAHFHNLSKKKSLENFKKKININHVLNNCTDNKKSIINGGVLLFKPNKDILLKFENLLDLIIKNNCIFPNEALFVLLYDEIYNLPINYNIRRFINYPDIKIYGRHYDCSIYKPLNIIKDNYYNKVKTNVVKQSILYFKKKYYDVYNKEVSNIIKKVTKKLS